MVENIDFILGTRQLSYSNHTFLRRYSDSRQALNLHGKWSGVSRYFVLWAQIDPIVSKKSSLSDWKFCHWKMAVYGIEQMRRNEFSQRVCLFLLLSCKLRANGNARVCSWIYIRAYRKFNNRADAFVHMDVTRMRGIQHVLILVQWSYRTAYGVRYTLSACGFTEWRKWTAWNYYDYTKHAWRERNDAYYLRHLRQ